MMSAATSALAYSASRPPPCPHVCQWSVLPVQGRPRVDLPEEAVSGEALLSTSRKPNVWTLSWTVRSMTAPTALVAGALDSSPVRPMLSMELSFRRAGGGGENQQKGLCLFGRNDIDRVGVRPGCLLTMWTEDNFAGLSLSYSTYSRNRWWYFLITLQRHLYLDLKNNLFDHL